MSAPRDKGCVGEAAVRMYLEAKGYVFVAGNVRVGHDEIDLIMRDGRALVFVEVKLRSEDLKGLEAVDEGKRRRLSRAAVGYLAKNGGLERAARFDVAEVCYDGAQMEIHHVKDAFPLSHGRYFV